jgi:alpha,alpha-trehalose phosphorylase (configuration-retaining)
VASSISDGTYTIDFAVHSIGGKPQPAAKDYLSARHVGLLSPAVTPSSGDVTPAVPTDEIPGLVEQHFLNIIRTYAKEHHYKFVGVGITQKLASMSPKLPARIWAELDIVPLVFEQGLNYPAKPANRRSILNVDEEADSMARKCCMFFGPTCQPRIQVGYQNAVEVDVGGHVQLATIDMYQSTVHYNTWLAAMKYASELKARNIRIAFFNSTPQGGGVALMRHALIRFFRTVGVECTW